MRRSTVLKNSSVRGLLYTTVGRHGIQLMCVHAMSAYLSIYNVVSINHEG